MSEGEEPHTCSVWQPRSPNVMSPFGARSVFRNAEVVALLWATALRGPRMSRQAERREERKMLTFCFLPSLPIFPLLNAMTALHVKQVVLKE